MSIIPDWANPFADAEDDTTETTEETEEADVEAEETEAETQHCDYCDFSTDTENGLAIHEGRVHGQQDEEDTTEEE